MTTFPTCFTRYDTSLDPVQIRRDFARDLFIVDQKVGQNPILVGCQPGAAGLAAGEVFGFGVRRDFVTDLESVDLIADGDDFSGSVVADDTMWCDGPGVSSVCDVGFSVI